MNLVRLSLRPAGLKQHLLRAAFSSSAPATTTQHHHHHHQHVRSDGPLRVATPPRAVWKVPPAAAVGTHQREARRSAIHPEVSHFILPRATTAVLQGPIQQQVGPAPQGDLRLVEFMEQVKQELWEFNAMPLRKRFRIQSLLRCVFVGAKTTRIILSLSLSAPFFVGERPRESLLG